MSVTFASQNAESKDERLDVRAMQGDRQAWDALIQRHERRVIVALLGQGVPMDRARELAQETWIRLMEQARRARLAELRLPGLAISQALWLAREDRRGRWLDTTDEVPEMADPALDPERQLVTAEALARARRVLSTCAPSAQKIFETFHTHPELTHAEIAERVGLSTQRVRQVLCEVRKRLRAELSEEPT